MINKKIDDMLDDVYYIKLSNFLINVKEKMEKSKK